MTGGVFTVGIYCRLVFVWFYKARGSPASSYSSLAPDCQVAITVALLSSARIKHRTRTHSRH